ncbi:MAG: branched-chain amino acid transport system permease protein [Thermoanaerobaculia bacterium]|jgi:branched-chain amino acid transport system permease protein|nr:branched-chain amino acid transport system permease protein [Thermoanaerobaculia bacterium]
MSYWITQLLNGLSFGMLLFFLASGLTLTLGVMRVTNLTHGSFYLIGAYVALTCVRTLDSFAMAAVIAAVVVAVVGAMVFGLLQITGTDPLRETLLTFGLIFIISDIALMLWGGDPVTVAKPKILSGPLDIGGFYYPRYRFFIIALGVVIAATMELVQRKTLIGARIRAVVDDVEMAGGIGLNARLIAFATFLVGAALAGLSGALGGAMIGAYPGADIEVLLYALVVVIIGGMGNLTGSLVGALAVGLIDAFGRAIVPELGASLMFFLMIGTLIIKPTGLFGSRS